MNQDALEAARNKLDGGQAKAACTDLRAVLRQCKLTGGDPLEPEAKTLLAESLFEYARNFYLEDNLTACRKVLDEATDLATSLEDRGLVKDARDLQLHCDVHDTRSLIVESRLSKEYGNRDGPHQHIKIKTHHIYKHTDFGAISDFSRPKRVI